MLSFIVIVELCIKYVTEFRTAIIQDDIYGQIINLFLSFLVNALKWPLDVRISNIISTHR